MALCIYRGYEWILNKIKLRKREKNVKPAGCFMTSKYKEEYQILNTFLPALNQVKTGWTVMTGLNFVCLMKIRFPYSKMY